MRKLLLTATALGLIAGAAQATEIINFSGGLADDFVATNPTSSTTHLAIADASVTISGLLGNPGVTAGIMDLSADNTGAAVLLAGFVIQHFNGSFCIASLAGCGGTVFLQGNFIDAALGVNGGTGLDVNVANPPDALTMSSAVIPAVNLLPPSAFDLSLSDVTPPLGIGAGGTIAPFIASFTGDASAGAVPEPASLAILGVGLLGLGFVANKRRS